MVFHGRLIGREGGRWYGFVTLSLNVYKGQSSSCLIIMVGFVVGEVVSCRK